MGCQKSPGLRPSCLLGTKRGPAAEHGGGEISIPTQSWPEAPDSCCPWGPENEDMLGKGFYPLEASSKVVLIKLWCSVTGKVQVGIFNDISGAPHPPTQSVSGASCAGAGGCWAPEGIPCPLSLSSFSQPGRWLFLLRVGRRHFLCILSFPPAPSHL